MATLKSSKKTVKVSSGSTHRFYTETTYSISTTATTVRLSVTKVQVWVDANYKPNVDGWMDMPDEPKRSFDWTQVSNSGSGWKSGTIWSGTYAHTWTRTTSAYARKLTVTCWPMAQGEDSGVTATLAVQVPALASYAVTYDAAGGQNAPATQTKWHGQALQLASRVPDRAGWAFQGWSASAGGTSAQYRPGQQYTADAALALHAVWQAVPAIGSFTAVRCDADGNADDAGTCALVTCAWSLPDPAASASLSCSCAPQGGSSADAVALSPASGAGGTSTAVVAGMDADGQYSFSVTATCSRIGAQAVTTTTATTRTAVLTRALFAMDFRAGGRAVGILSAAPESGVAVGGALTFPGGAISENGATARLGPANRVLWSGGSYMNGSQTISLSQPVSSQLVGVVLVFSYYDGGSKAAVDSDFNFTLVPKWHVSAHNGAGVTCWMSNSDGGILATKYLYVYDTQIRGWSGNGEASRTASGVAHRPASFVLRAVLGV